MIPLFSKGLRTVLGWHIITPIGFLQRPNSTDKSMLKLQCGDEITDFKYKSRRYKVEILAYRRTLPVSIFGSMSKVSFPGQMFPCL